MKADNYGFDRMVLSYVANQIVNQVKGVIRAVFDVKSKIPGYY